MPMRVPSSEYKDLLKRGPFPGRVDPWAEVGRYFHQIHNSMIEHILDQLQDSLEDMGYVAARETSLQIIANRQPDISITREIEVEVRASRWDYAAAATAVMAEPDAALLTEMPELDALHIFDDNGELVTVIEVVSPSNKTEIAGIVRYQTERAHLFLSKNVNVVEIDPTRSIKRLLEDERTSNYPYHSAVFIPTDQTYVLVNEFEQPLKRVAVPLRSAVIPVEPHHAYIYAYHKLRIAKQLQNQYTEKRLPFPSLLTPTQRQEALEAVQRWRDELKRLEAS